MTAGCETSAIGAALLLGALAPTSPASGAPASCGYTPDVALNAGLVAGEPKAGLLYLTAHGRFYRYRCSSGDTGTIYVPTTPK
jgi:hypothetical protein